MKLRSGTIHGSPEPAVRADTQACADPAGDDISSRRQFFARLARMSARLAAIGTLAPSAQRGAKAASGAIADALPLTEARRRADDIARLAANLAQPDIAVGKVTISRYGAERGDPVLKMVAPGLWRRWSADGLEGEPIADASLDREGEWGIDAAGQLVFHRNSGQG